ncbi:MAG: DUF1361 domain-containing protein [Oscillospiraceae bacterium]|nr:DUF1361 domain-containing protein [Oscillospiraceae bacterium]MDD4414454.1 DUF1361 domain-containing protein [Oscillospiraceae bacterium]
MAIISKFLNTVKQNTQLPVIFTTAFCFAYILFSLVLYFCNGFHFIHGIIAWNLFLAALPLVFSVLADFAIKSGRKALAVMAGILWLLFFPNSPYLITDIIHLHIFDYYGMSGYVRNISEWVWLMYMSVGILLGVVTGMMSLELFYQRIVQRKGRGVAYSAILAVVIISGYAIYIGRFLRLNSWDIIRPWFLVQKLVKNIDSFAVAFSLSMSVCILLVYVLFHAFFSNSAKLSKSQ